MKKLLFILFFLSQQASATTYYWVKNTPADWDNVSMNWSLTSGGVSTFLVPTSTDDCVFDANSGTNITTVQTGAACNSVDFTGYRGTVTLNANLPVDNTMILYNRMTWTDVGSNFEVTFNFANSATGTLFTNNLASFGCGIDMAGAGTLTVQGDLNGTPTSYLYLLNGTFECSTFNPNITTGSFFSDMTNPMSLNMGSGTWRMLDSDASSIFGGVWNINDNSLLTLSAGTSTLSFDNSSANTKSFGLPALTGSQIYNNIVFKSGSGVFIVNNSPTLNDLSVTTPRVIINFEDASTTTVASLTLNGTLGFVNILSGVSSGWSIVGSGSPICADYINLSNSTASGVSFYGGCHSIDGGGNSGWIFNNCGSSCAAFAHSFGIIIN